MQALFRVFSKFFPIFSGRTLKIRGNPWPGCLFHLPHFEVDFRVLAFVRSTESKTGFRFLTSSGMTVFGKREDSKRKSRVLRGARDKSTN